MAIYFLNDAHNLARSEALFAEELYHKMVATTEDYRLRADKAVNKFQTIKGHARVCIAHACANAPIGRGFQDMQMFGKNRYYNSLITRVDLIYSLEMTDARDESRLIHQQASPPAVSNPSLLDYWCY